MSNARQMIVPPVVPLVDEDRNVDQTFADDTTVNDSDGNILMPDSVIDNSGSTIEIIPSSCNCCWFFWNSARIIFVRKPEYLEIASKTFLDTVANSKRCD
jgi:hypothetical protein